MNTGGFIDKGAGGGGDNTGDKRRYVVGEMDRDSTDLDMSARQLADAINSLAGAIDHASARLAGAIGRSSDAKPPRTKQLMELYQVCARYVDGEATYEEVHRAMIDSRN